MANKKEPSRVQVAAGIYGCEVEALMAYREKEDGSVVIIAPSGQKFRYSAQRLAQERMKILEAALEVVKPTQNDKSATQPASQDEVGINPPEVAAVVDKKKTSKSTRSVKEA